jgi:DNA-binding transcriptional LysR family regulator
MDEAALAVLRLLDASTELSGLVRLAAGRVLAERFLMDRLRAFHERYPAIDLEVIGGPRIVSLAKREADVALRYGPPKDSELVARRVATITFGLYVPRPSGWPASLATNGFLFVPTARQRRLPRLARATALRFFQDTSWRLMSRTSCRSRWEGVYRSAMCGFWSVVI